MEASSSAPNELAVLLQRIVTVLPPETHVLVLRDLPTPELARLSCVNKALRVAWRSLRDQHPGKRYDPPSADDLEWAKGHPWSPCSRESLWRRRCDPLYDGRRRGRAWNAPAAGPQ